MNPNDPNTTIIFPASFAAVATCAAKDGGRYAMDACEIRRKGDRVSVVATDGKRAIIATATLPEEDIARTDAKGDGVKLIPAGVMKGVKPSASKPWHASVNGRLEHAGVSLELGAPIEGDFPPVADVLGPPVGRALMGHAVLIGLNAGLLRDTLDAVIRATGEKASALIIELAVTDEKTAIRIEARLPHAETRITAVLMPVQMVKRMKDDEKDTAADIYVSMCK